MLDRREADSRDAGQAEAILEGYWTERRHTEEMLDRGRQDWRDTRQKGGRQKRCWTGGGKTGRLRDREKLTGLGGGRTGGMLEKINT